MRAVTVKTLRHLGGGAVSYSRRSLAYPAHEVVGMPALSPTMESGNDSIIDLIYLFVKNGPRLCSFNIVLSLVTTTTSQVLLRNGKRKLAIVVDQAIL